ncbi:MAG: C40 family peptidase [Lachnospiraceae bacterium]|nr:C40 family peptidase [Lachnospiraceae bacterium]
MERKMDKSKLRAVVGLSIASFCVVGLGHVVSAGNIPIVNEKPMAGLTLSFEKYCDAVVDELSGDSSSIEEMAGISEQVESQGIEALSAATEANASQETDAAAAQVKETTLTDAGQSKPEKTPEPKIKLNLVYDRLGVVQVNNYVNVRKGPSENSKIVGKMTNNSGCNVYKIEKGWAKIVSGGVRGWVKADYMITDKKAEEKAQKVATLRARVTTETLNVRYLPSTDANIYDQISADEDYKIAKEKLTKSFMDDYIKKNVKKSQLSNIDKEAMYGDLENWVMISIDNDKAFVSKDFINVTYNLNRAVTIKESEESTNSSSGGSSSSTSSSKASSLIAYAMQFLGNRYVYGGTSLTNGTDCSGFTMRVYQRFGYSLPRTSSSQAAATRTVARGSERPGDLFFYGSGGVSHVALYIGNGQIIHASNPSDGIKISNAYYRKPIKIGRVM